MFVYPAEATGLLVDLRISYWWYTSLLSFWLFIWIV